jgi:predicted TIM-barrel fold metal-dependent hydrolase
MVELVDIQAGFGGLAPALREAIPAEMIVSQLRRHRIAQAVVRITPEAQDFDLCRSNQRLYEQTARFPGELLPCPIALPAACGDVPAAEAQVAEALRHGAPAVVLRPGPDRWEPEPWVVGPLLQVLAAHRLPVLCLERLVPAAVVARWAGLAPELPLIIAETAYGRDRTLLPLLQEFPNTYLSIGNNFTAHRGIEFYVSQVGAGRLLFGTGLPDCEPGAAIGQLVFAELAEADRQRIGSGNFRRLQGGIRP